MYCRVIQFVLAALVFSVSAQTEVLPTCPISNNIFTSMNTSSITNGCSDYYGGATSTFCTNCNCGIITVSIDAFVIEANTTDISFCSQDLDTMLTVCEPKFEQLLLQNGILSTGILNTVANCTVEPYYTTCTDAINIWDNWYSTNCKYDNPTVSPRSTTQSTSDGYFSKNLSIFCSLFFLFLPYILNCFL
jgi:hypothetical protein